MKCSKHNAEAIAVCALQGLAADCDDRAYTLIERRTAYGTFELERNAAVRALAGCALHLKEPKRALLLIEGLALHDPLTDLPNRVFLREELEKRLRRLRHGEKFAVLWLDLDRFKSVNDSLGHPIGDKLLNAVATTLSNCIDGDDFVARLGVDEFAIKVVKLEGEFVWHQHADADEVFYVIAGGIRMKYRLGDSVQEVSFGPGELLRIPRGIEHLPIALPGTELVLFERADLVNTGNVRNERTIAAEPI